MRAGIHAPFLVPLTHVPIMRQLCDQACRLAEPPAAAEHRQPALCSMLCCRLPPSGTLSALHACACHLASAIRPNWPAVMQLRHQHRIAHADAPFSTLHDWPARSNAVQRGRGRGAALCSASSLPAAPVHPQCLPSFDDGRQLAAHEALPCTERHPATLQPLLTATRGALNKASGRLRHLATPAA
jgi:hypothetical protein